MHRFTAINHGVTIWREKQSTFLVASQYHNKSGKNSSTLPVSILMTVTWSSQINSNMLFKPYVPRLCVDLSHLSDLHCTENE
ncbi:hypothetical protein E4T42_03648 [Aureobasidium subglaciale]|nr:hypothetical protein E4T42_03648 [Aureobasidium subglaciale]